MDKVIEQIARTMFFGEIKCDPSNLMTIWNSLSDEDKQYQVGRVMSWMEELKITSPKTFRFIMENYDDE